MFFLLLSFWCKENDWVKFVSVVLWLLIMVLIIFKFSNVDVYDFLLLNLCKILIDFCVLFRVVMYLFC